MDPLFPLAALALAAAVALALVGFRDPKANEHDLADYHEPTADRLWLHRLKLAEYYEPAVEDWDYVPAPIPAQRRPLEDILPPAPPGMNAGSPLYAGMLFDTWHPESPADTADRFLREIAAEQQAKDGIRPAGEHWALFDGSCWDDCPGCARDMTGAFPVVAVA